jgi:predicted DCC family thiol-disulfide oxidoreductase YuxK
MTSDLKPSPAKGAPVLLYDGECGLCNRAVRLLLRIDAGGVLRFASLQGGPGQAWLRLHGLATSGFDSMVFIRDWGPRGGGDAFALRTDALVAALQACGGWGRVLGWIRVVPRPLRDAAYRLVARFRYRLFGPWRPLPLARPEWAGRFISES